MNLIYNFKANCKWSIFTLKASISKKTIFIFSIFNKNLSASINILTDRECTKVSSYDIIYSPYILLARSHLWAKKKHFEKE